MRRKWRRLGLALLVLLVPTGCYDSQPLKESAIVMGTGIDKDEDKDGYMISVEILRVGAIQEGAAGGGDSNTGQKRSVVLRIHADDLFTGVRDLIRYTKRRLFFTHNRVWIISERAAKDNILKPFDSIMRDQMLRLNSFLFVSQDNPEEVLTTSTLLEGLVSLELFTGMEAVRFIGGNTEEMYMKDLFEMLSGPVKAGIVPMIKLAEETEGKITKLHGIAIVKDDKMVGKLTHEETIGLLWLRGDITHGFLTTSGDALKEPITIELTSQKTKLKTKLVNESLTADFEIKLRGTVAVNPPEFDLFQPGVKQRIQRDAESWVKKMVEATLNKLQKEYQADVINIGLETYRKSPKAFNKVKDHWDEVFKNANINVKVEADIYHPGLINRSKGTIDRKPEKNPYQRLFFWD